MEVINFEPALTEEWDAFVRRHPLAGFGHLPGNFALAAETPGVRNISLLAREGRTLVGVLPLFEQRARTLRAVTIKELVSGPFFPGGPLIATTARGKQEASAMTALLDAMRDRARATGCDRVLAGYPNVTAGQPTITRLGYSPLLHHGFRARPGVGLWLDLSQSVEQLAAARKSGCRQTVTKAQAAGVTVQPIADRETWMQTDALNRLTLGELALNEPQLAAIWDAFIARGDASAFGVYADGALAAVTVTIHFNGAAYYWHGWRSQAPVNGASHLGLWSAILASRQQGCAAFELGSLEFEHARNIGISQFKQSFGGVPFQTMGAQLDLKPLKSAAIALAEAAVTAVRARRTGAAPVRAAVTPAPPPVAVPVRT